MQYHIKLFHFYIENLQKGAQKKEMQVNRREKYCSESKGHNEAEALSNQVLSITLCCHAAVTQTKMCPNMSPNKPQF